MRFSHSKHPFRYSLLFDSSYHDDIGRSILVAFRRNARVTHGNTFALFRDMSL